MLPITERTIAPGVTLRAVQTKKFKTAMLSVTFLEPISAETAASNALIPRVLRQGTQKHPDIQSLSVALDELYGGSIKPIVRKKGEVQCVGFWGSFLDDAFVPEETKILEEATQLLGALVLQPAGEGSGFLPAYVEREKGNLIDKIRSQINDKMQYALSKTRELMCEGEPYAVDKLGSEQAAQEITGETLYARYQSLLKTAPVCFYYAGSAEPDRVEAAFRSAFSALPKTERHPIPQTMTVATPAGAVRRETEKMDVTQGKLVLGFRTGGAFRTAEAIAPAMLFQALYGGSTNSKLFLNVREKLSLCYFANSTLALSKGLLMVYSGVEFANFKKAEDEILAQLKACYTGDVTEEELEAARRSVVRSLRSTSDAQGRLEEFWLSRVVTGSSFSPEDLAEQVSAVRLDKIEALAKAVALDSVYTLTGRGEEA